MNQKAKDILRPLFVWGFIQALVFWYAIEKLLWANSGITADQIIILGLVAQSSQVLIEVPSSIIADRWSRRKTLIASSVFMVLCIVIVLLSRSFVALALMSFVWACYYSFQSGTVNAYIYDLLKEGGETDQYRKAASRYSTYQLSALLISSLVSSILIKTGSLLTPYWVTLIPASMAIIILARMHDPEVERTHESTGTALHHVRSAARQITKQGWLIIVFTALALVTAGQFIWYEYYQLYAIKQAVAPVLFGLMLALIHVGNLVGAEFAHRVKDPKNVMYVAFVALLLSTFSLAFVSGSVAIIIFMMMCFFGSQAVSIVLDESLQHQISSELRSTTLSLTGLISRVFFGVAAVAIIAFNTTPKSIALITFVTFLCVAIYLPVRKRLVTV